MLLRLILIDLFLININSAPGITFYSKLQGLLQRLLLLLLPRFKKLKKLLLKVLLLL